MLLSTKVLIEGEHKNIRAGDGSGYFIDPIFSSSTLIITDINILVDTSNRFMKNKVIEGLRENNLHPDDIDFVILTHFHLDHLENIATFKNAKILASNVIRSSKGRAKIYYKLPKNVIKDIEIFKTPGHTLDSISIKAGDTIIAGDAVREDIILSQKLPAYQNGEKYLNSMKTIFSMKPKKIIPGHGSVIEGEKLENMRKLVKNFTMKNVF